MLVFNSAQKLKQLLYIHWPQFAAEDYVDSDRISRSEYEQLKTSMELIQVRKVEHIFIFIFSVMKPHLELVRIIIVYTFF